jgi:tRNA (guanine37-N1)-methyltransferase
VTVGGGEVEFVDLFQVRDAVQGGLRERRLAFEGVEQDALEQVADAEVEGFRQARAADLASRSHLVFVCPRYEGVDERIRSLVDLELSIGDYVLTGGELPALVVIDAVIRLLPGAIEDASTVEESFSDGLLEYPQYTRPAVFRGMGVPSILTSGDHGAVARWRHEQSIERTRRRRPDLATED